MDATRELAAFLRTRRERLSPGDVALPRRGRLRRTPGLRREEVAELAGVSVDYVVRLEQGRGPRPSPEVLDGLSRALRLDEDERAYLFALTDRRPTGGRRGPTPAAVPLARLVDDLSPLPAMLMDHRFDILAWNPEMAALMSVDLDALPHDRRNALWLCMLHPDLRDFFRDRERLTREAIADLRVTWAAHPDDAELAALVGELLAESEEFARLWELRDVRVNGRGLKPLLHPRVGPLTIEFEVLTPLQPPDQRLVVYRAADAPSQAALDALSREITTEARTLRAL